MSTKMAKLGRGRPRKIASHNLFDSRDRGEAMVKSDGEALYSDEFPEFFKIYVPAMCSQSMRIPPEFIEKFGGNIPTIVALRRPISGTSTWQVDMKRINEHWFFQKGWPQFVKENSVQDGDFMAFSYAGNSMFFVKVFSINGCITSRIAIDDHGQSIQNHQLPHQSSQPPENSKRNRSVLTRNVSPKSRIARQSVLCRNPCFSHVLVKSYVLKGYLHVPMMFWKAYMRKHENGSRMVTLRVKNNSWLVELLILEDRVMLSKGWSQFVKDNSLRTGNICTFQLIDTANLAFEVTVK